MAMSYYQVFFANLQGTYLLFQRLLLHHNLKPKIQHQLLIHRLLLVLVSLILHVIVLLTHLDLFYFSSNLQNLYYIVHIILLLGHKIHLVSLHSSLLLLLLNHNYLLLFQMLVLTIQLKLNFLYFLLFSYFLFHFFNLINLH